MNSLIREMTHLKQEPLRIEREYSPEGREFILIEGVRYDSDYFRTFAHPETDVLYGVVREEDDVVRLTVIADEDEAQRFFEEIASAAPRNDMMEEDDGL